MVIARYQLIAEDLLRKISAGDLPVGSLLPTEIELMQSYCTSRNTVRSALLQLQARGLISRRRNRGTRVEALPGSGGSFTQALASLEGLLTLASTARREILESERVVLDGPTGRMLHCPPGSRWYRIGMIRWEVGQSRPLGWTDAFVDPHYAAVAELAQRHPDRLLTDLIEAEYGRQVERVEQSVYACAVGERRAQALGVAREVPALRVVRQYRDAANAVVVVTQSIYPEARYSLSSTWVRAGRVAAA